MTCCRAREHTTPKSAPFPREDVSPGCHDACVHFVVPIRPHTGPDVSTSPALLPTTNALPVRHIPALLTAGIDDVLINTPFCSSSMLASFPFAIYPQLSPSLPLSASRLPPGRLHHSASLAVPTLLAMPSRVLSATTSSVLYSRGIVRTVPEASTTPGHCDVQMNVDHCSGRYLERCQTTMII